ncbi:unnamed protein product [Rotaria socialis]|uniref:RRM domain-containing protein n=6 Tax=Rotaria TaxID=231623 RepID=A0A818LD55_9BILA|nr:unnamed protein product [Rotaria socialis]CAF4619435.1 unnamed protein product [Rotaria socialis]
MSNESSATKFVLPANASNSTSTATKSSPPPHPSLSLHCDQQQININGNGILNDGKLAPNNYQNGVLSDLQTTFQGSSWSNIMDPLSGTSGDHPFDVHNGNRMFEPPTTSPTPLMTMQQQMSYQQTAQRRPITAAHNFPIQNIRSGNGVPTLPMNGRWNSQSPSMGPPSHIQQQQQQPQSPTWNTTSSIPHGFPATSSRCPVPSLTNPNNPNSHGKKGPNNFFSFLPPSTSQNSTSLNNVRSASMINNFLATQNGQSSSQIMNGDMGQNFTPMNSGDAYDMSSFYQAMDMMRNVPNDGVKRVYSEDSGMGSILDTESLMSVGGPSSSSSTGLFNSSSRIMPIDMNKEERFSRKVFVGGLPPDIDEEEIIAHFQRFGPLVVDWPHKQESKSYFPPKGYAFLIFTYERSVQELIDECVIDDSKLYMCVSSPSMKDKAVQIRPWLLADSDFVMDGTQPLDPRKTIFVGGVPRPLRAVELAMIMDRLYGGVCYAGIDTDPELKYPKGAGRVAFSNQQSYIAAISARFVQLQHGDIDKRVEVKPYVLDDQLCDECAGARCGGKFAPFFCANVTCLQYYCEACWASIHARSGREYHKPLVKEGADRPRTLPFRW